MSSQSDGLHCADREPCVQGTLLPKAMGQELLDMQEHAQLTVLARQVPALPEPVHRRWSTGVMSIALKR